MKKILFSLIMSCTLTAFSQTTETVSIGIGFQPPIDRVILVKLEEDKTDMWEKFIRVNYNLYLNDSLIDPKDLKRRILKDSSIKNLVTIQTKKK